jgi:hypothetical protein
MIDVTYDREADFETYTIRLNCGANEGHHKRAVILSE